MSKDEHDGRPHGRLASIHVSPATDAEDDRRRAAEDRRQAARYLSAAYRDEVTGALSRRPGREQLQVLLDRAHRDASVLTFMFIDVDGLKRVNDLQGHERGDALLEAVGTALRVSLRSYDVVVRYGGDEFVCGLPGGNAAVAEESLGRVRSVLVRLMPGATVSAGYAVLQPADTIDDVIRRADSDLYRARRSAQSAGWQVPLANFVLELTAQMTRSATCTGCGATTVIQLTQVSPPPPNQLAVRADG